MSTTTNSEYEFLDGPGSTRRNSPAMDDADGDSPAASAWSLAL
ncbi:MAG TPA: hypothetical protein VNV88_08055 [Candidatus Solibacter sp.]|nr:hypothetical protein [Candidatus Solibacter sp.]